MHGTFFAVSRMFHECVAVPNNEEGQMKKHKKLGFAAGVVALVAVFGIGFAAPKDATFTGEIMDPSCAKAGSHAAMTVVHKDMTARDCTLACVMGAKGEYVLYDAATKTVYRLDNQPSPQEFAGQKVKVTGTLNKKTSTIHVTGIDRT
jgi:hypothetical protein